MFTIIVNNKHNSNIIVETSRIFCKMILSRVVGCILANINWITIVFNVVITIVTDVITRFICSRSLYSPEHGWQRTNINVSLDIENISVLKQKKQKQSTPNDFYYSGSSLEYFGFYHIDMYRKIKKLNSINAKYITSKQP